LRPQFGELRPFADFPVPTEAETGYHLTGYALSSGAYSEIGIIKNISFSAVLAAIAG
jgi:hypothetical protein